MVEYLFDAIKAVAGETFTVTAEITDELQEPIKEQCSLVIYDAEENEISTIKGILEDNVWNFTIPSTLTSGFSGRYWYCIKCGIESLSFKQPLYF